MKVKMRVLYKGESFRFEPFLIDCAFPKALFGLYATINIIELLKSY